MSPNVDITIRTINENDQATNKAVGSLTELNSAISLVSRGMQVAKQLYAETAGVTFEYAGQVRDLAAITGTGAESSSRLLQVLDDFEIGAGDVTAATRVMTKQGLSPTIETLAQLSDQFLAIEDPVKRADFVMQNLGRGGAKWVNVLQQGSENILALNEGVNQNLILTDQQVQQTERYRLKMDEVSDTIQGWKIQATLAFFDITDKTALHAEAIKRVAEAHNMNAYVMQKQQGTYADEIAAMELAITSEQELTDGLKGNSEALLDNSDALALIDYGKLISGIQSAQQETDRFIETNDDLNKQIAEQTEKIAQLTAQGYSPMGETIQKEQEKLNGLTGKLNENAAAHDKWQKQTVFAFAQAAAAADGQITQKEGAILTNMGVQLGLFDQKTADAMTAVTEAFNSVDPSSAESAIASVNDALNALDGTTATTYINVITTTTGGGTGGGCFIAGTPVAMMDGDEKAIEDLIVGDEVLVHDFDKGINTPSKITKVFHHTELEMPGYYLLINDRIAVTPNHNMYTADGWIVASDLILGNRLFSLDDGYEAIVSIETIRERVPVYNIEVEHAAHNYFADGVLVHNLKRTQTIGGAVSAGSSGNAAGGGLIVNIETMNVFANDSEEFALSLGEL